MNKLITIINQIMHNQGMVWLLGTLVGVSCIAIYAGLKIGALILGIWTLVSVIVYYIRNS